MIERRVPSPDAMRQLGAEVGRAASAGDRFLLEGPFGAGKTTFVQGLAEGLGVRTPVSSPSFVIETRYQGRLTLYHVDLYRLDGVEAELYESLVEDLLGDGVAAVEWAERLPDELRAGATLVRFVVEADDSRVVRISPSDTRLAHALAS